jgi:hypothetical protein
MRARSSGAPDAAARRTTPATVWHGTAWRTAHNARKIYANLGYVRPEKQTVEGRADTPAGAAMSRDLSQISRRLTGRQWTMASMPDSGQDADVRIRIPAH